MSAIAASLNDMVNNILYFLTVLILLVILEATQNNPCYVNSPRESECNTENHP